MTAFDRTKTGRALLGERKKVIGWIAAHPGHAGTHAADVLACELYAAALNGINQSWLRDAVDHTENLGLGRTGILRLRERLSATWAIVSLLVVLYFLAWNYLTNPVNVRTKPE